MSSAPNTLQLRFLQTLTEVASERNSTIIFPVPIDIIQAFMSRGGAALAASGGGASPGVTEPPASSSLPGSESAEESEEKEAEES
jgi:hypothetical protein